MRQVFLMGGLLSAALVGSYLTWTAEEPVPNAEDRVAMFESTGKDVDHLTWKGKDLTVDLEKKTDDLGQYTWVTVTEQKAKIEPGDTAAASDSTPETITVSFKGNEDAEALWRLFAPLHALRGLTSPDRSMFKLDDPFAKIEINRASGPVELVVGGETYGSKDRYVGLGDQVFLVDDQDLKTLQFGKTRLVDRKLQPMENGDIEAIKVKEGDQEVEFHQKNGTDPKTATWTRKDLEDPAARVWLGKLLKLRVQNYVLDSDLADATPALTFDVTGHGQSWSVQLFQGTGDTPDYFAKSPYNRGAVKLTRSMAHDILSDSKAVLAGTAPPPPPEASPPAGGAPPDDVPPKPQMAPPPPQAVPPSHP